MEAREPSPSKEGQPSLVSAWAQYDRLSARLSGFLKTSELEFVSLIDAFDACWKMAENVQRETAQLSEFTDGASASHTAIIRTSLLEACVVFKGFLLPIQEVGHYLAGTAEQAGALLSTARHLEEKIAPLKHIAFHFRVEAARLSAKDRESVEKACEEMKQVVGLMDQAGESQRRALLTILEKLAAATQSVAQTCSNYAVQAGESEHRVARNLDLLSAPPRNLLRVKNKSISLGVVLTNSIREAGKALQGHDAMRQRLEHILGSLADLQRGRQKEEAEHALLLQRQQAKGVLAMVLDKESRIVSELKNVIGCAQGIAGDGSSLNAIGEDVQRFEEAIERLTAMCAEVEGLLAGEAAMGKFVASQIEPICALLSANSRDLESVAYSLKRLALNVLVDADKVPSAPGMGVLGIWTAEVAEEVLQLAGNQNLQFAALEAALRSQTGVIAADVLAVESCHGLLEAQKATDALRHSRRNEHEVVSQVCQEALQLKEKTESLIKCLRFADEGSKLLAELDSVIVLLLSLFPKSEKPFDLAAASAGYTMREQHQAHAVVSGAESGIPVPGQEYGDNVELF